MSHEQYMGLDYLNKELVKDAATATMIEQALLIGLMVTGGAEAIKRGWQYVEEIHSGKEHKTETLEEIIQDIQNRSKKDGDKQK